MSKLIDALQTNDELTANGAVTHSTTNSRLLDLFSVAGSLRGKSKPQILNLWNKAYAENSNLALRILLWIRDCRGGAGERRTFRIIYNHLKQSNYTDSLRVLNKLPEVGRWDDIWGGTTKDIRKQNLPSKDELEFLAANIDNSLLCKWLPRKGIVLSSLASMMGISEYDLKKRIVKNTKVVEQLMSAREWSKINYKTVPSKAMALYSSAFGRRDSSRFSKYINNVKAGNVKINASTLFPYDLLLDYAKGKNKDVVELQWKALPNYSTKQENVLVVADVSGSMGSFGNTSLMPIHASISLAIYCSERNEGIFKDAFLTFSDNPKLQTLSGNFGDKITQLSRAEWGMSTNLQAVFDLILSKAVENDIPESEMPTKIIIISDMEFNSCCNNSSNFKTIDKKYNKSGYSRPALVFWNVNGREKNCPAKLKDNNVALISGYSPSIIPSILGESIDPFSVMLKTIMKEKYDID